MTEVSVQQALFAVSPTEGFTMRGRSSGFLDTWLAECERLCHDFGQRPPEIACPLCLFVRPLGKQHVALVQVADQAEDRAILGFHFLVGTGFDYRGLGADPFALAERFPPPWSERGELSRLTLPAVRFPERTVSQVQEILKGADAPTLLGGAQALVDGGQLVFERSAPDAELLRSLWALLPTTTRAALWPATFAFSNALGFDLIVVPPGVLATAPVNFEHYLGEQQAGDYPQGYYELNLRIAVEDGDQAALDALLARRSRAETWRLGWILLIVSLLLMVLVNVFNPRPRSTVRKSAPATTAQP